MAYASGQASFGRYFQDGSGGLLANIGYRPTTVSYTGEALPSVPEPATWAMFIGGFGLVGSTLRRRRPASVSAA